MTESVLTANPLFWRMYQSAANQGKADTTLMNSFIVLGIDPGETTGVAWRIPWEEGFQVHVDQIKTPDLEFGADSLEEWLHSFATSVPILTTVEDYKVYSWKTDSHKFAGLHTPQLIGAIRRMVHKRANMYYHTRMAQGAKAFATDELLKNLNLYDPGQRHGRDASRHLLTTIFFGKAPNLPIATS